MKTIITVMALVLCLGVATSGVAEEKKVIETWECADSSYSPQVLVVAEVNEGRKIGKIAVAGITYDCTFNIQGFDRRWDFGFNKKTLTYDYAFFISPNGRASYYEFAGEKGSTEPSSSFYCKMK